MAAESEGYVLEILSILEDRMEPLGSGQLSRLLHDRGWALSEATVGRILSSMDQEQLTEKLGFQGRVITAKGRAKLVAMRSALQRATYGNRFIETLEARRREDIIEILVARKAIERELARLAALYATAAEIQLLEEVMREHEESLSREKSSEDHDLKFHKLLSLAAKNKVLAAALDLIRHDEQLSPVLSAIRQRQGGRLSADHSGIVAAIKERNPDRAEREMARHVESVIADVQKYWVLVNTKDQDAN